MKIKLNLEHFQNITLYAPKELDKEGQYVVLLEQVEDWIGFTPHAKPLANHLRKILGLQPYISDEGKGETSVERYGDNGLESHKTDLPKTDSTPLPVIKTVDPLSDRIEYDGKTFEKFIPCKYKCGMFTAWGKPYKQGDKKLHLNPMTKEILGYDCPAFGGGG